MFKVCYSIGFHRYEIKHDNAIEMRKHVLLIKDHMLVDERYHQLKVYKQLGNGGWIEL